MWMSTNAIMDTSRERRRNKRWPEVLKHEIVAATLVPGASVSVVARRHNVTANQLFGWRRRYGEASAPLGRPPSTSGLVPVTITTEPENESAASRRTKLQYFRSGRQASINR